MSSASALNSIAEVLAARMGSTPEPVLQQTPAETPAAIETPTPPAPVVSQPPSAPSQAADPAAQPTTPGEVEDDYEFDPDAPVPEAKPDVAAQPEAGAEKAEDLDPDKDVVGAMLATSRGKRIYQDYKQLAGLAKPLEDGGIGFKPSNDQFREFYDSYVALQQMQGSLSSGDPNEVAKFFDNWLGRDPQTGQMRIPGADQALNAVPTVIAQQHPELLPQLAQTTFQALQRTNPEALRATVIDPASSMLQQQFYAMAQQNADPAQKEWLKTVGDSLEWLRTGQAPGQQPNTNTNGAPRSSGVDPEVARLRAELQAVRQQFNQGQQSQHQQAAEAINSEIASTSNRMLTEDIERALKVTEGLKMDPLVRNGLKDQFTKEVVEMVNKNSSVALELLNQKAAQAARTGNRAAIAQLTSEYRRLYSLPLTTLRTKYITAAGVQFKAKADEVNANLQRNQRPGANGGVSVAASATNNGRIEQLPGETTNAYMERVLQTKMRGY